MALPKASTANRDLASTRRLRRGGFTLMEMLIVIGIVLVIASAPLFIDLTSYRADAFRAEQSMLATLLQKARADALNNIDEKAHGVAIAPADHPHSYVVFEGGSYAASDPASMEVTDESYSVTFGAPSLREVVFAQLDASASASGDIVMVDSERGATTTITINREGGISW